MVFSLAPLLPVHTLSAQQAFLLRNGLLCGRHRASSGILLSLMTCRSVFFMSAVIVLVPMFDFQPPPRTWASREEMLWILVISCPNCAARG